MGLAIIVPSISFEDANLGKVTISGNVPVRVLDINLRNSYVGTEVDLKCSYLPTNTIQRNVIWSIESGSEYASISGSILTINSSAINSPVTIKCTSAENSSISTIKTITLTYYNGEDVPTIYDWLKTDASMASYVNIGKLGRNDKLTIIGKTLGFPSKATGSSAIFGVANKNTKWIYCVFFSFRGDYSTFGVDLGVSSTAYNNTVSSNSQETSIIIDLATGTIQYGDITGNATVDEDIFVNGETNYDCFVFAANRAGEAASFMRNDVYALKEFKIERNNQVIHDFKPASCEDGKGLYDTVTNQFKPNLGTGDFILEND